MEFSDSSFRETVEPYIVSQEHVRPTKIAYSDVEHGVYLYQGDCLEIMEEIIYVLDKSWFDKPKYKDVLDYIRSVNCNYCFDELPLAWLGLPTVEQCEGIRGAA
jgi:hypothetical protein